MLKPFCIFCRKTTFYSLTYTKPFKKPKNFWAKWTNTSLDKNVLTKNFHTEPVVTIFIFVLVFKLSLFVVKNYFLSRTAQKVIKLW